MFSQGTNLSSQVRAAWRQISPVLRQQLQMGAAARNVVRRTSGKRLVAAAAAAAAATATVGGWARGGGVSLAAGVSFATSDVSSPYKTDRRSHVSGVGDWDVSGGGKADEEGLPLVYDVEAVRSYWKSRPVEVMQRTAQVASLLGPYLAKLFIWEYFLRRKIREHRGLQKKYAVQLREILTELGPCFVKLGQALSIRPDVLPSSFLDELQKLCDSMPSFPTSDAIAVIEKELGPGSSRKIFEDFDSETLPIAAASLGQVYRLKLRGRGKSEGGEGEWVAVKVQRPDMTRFILRDLYIMRILASVIEKVKSKVTNNRPYDVALVDTFAAASINELDYNKEADNQELFRRDLMPKLKGRVYIPKVYRDCSTRKVLVTEWIEGEKLASSPKEVINRLTPVGIECFLCQLLETGNFHADPHPGNLLVTKDGKLAVIDFGLCAEVPLPDTRTMTLAIVHLIQGDVRGLIEDAIDLGFLPTDTDVGTLQVALQGIFDSAQIAVKEEIANSLKFRAVATRRKKFWAVSRDLNKVFFEYPFLVPDYFALITRAMIVLEGIAVTGDPEFDLFASSYPYAFKRAVSVFGMKNLAEIAKEAAVARMNMA